MPVIRANDPDGNNLEKQVKICLGKLCDHNLSVATQKSLVEKLTTLLNGKPFSIELFRSMRLQADIYENEKTRVQILKIKIPKEFVISTITENRDEQFVEFDIAKTLNLNFEEIHNSQDAKIADQPEIDD